MGGAVIIEVEYNGTTDDEKDSSCCRQCKETPECTFWVRDTGIFQSGQCWLKKDFAGYFEDSTRRGNHRHHQTTVVNTNRATTDSPLSANRSTVADNQGSPPTRDFQVDEQNSAAGYSINGTPILFTVILVMLWAAATVILLFSAGACGREKRYGIAQAAASSNIVVNTAPTMPAPIDFHPVYPPLVPGMRVSDNPLYTIDDDRPPIWVTRFNQSPPAHAGMVHEVRPEFSESDVSETDTSMGQGSEHWFAHGNSTTDSYTTDESLQGDTRF